MFRITGNPYSKNLMERSVLCYVFSIEKRPVYRIIRDCFYRKIQYTILRIFYLFSDVCFIFNYKDKIINNRNIFGITGIARPALRCSLQGFINFFYVASLGIIRDIAIP